MNIDAVLSRLLAIFALIIFFLISAHAGDATWDSSPISGDWNNPNNWTAAVVPNAITDKATFGVSTQTAVSISSGSVLLDRLTFNPGASVYTISYTGLNFFGIGIENNSGKSQSFVADSDGFSFPETSFSNSASAGSSTIFTNGGIVAFNDTSTAGSATFITKGPPNLASSGSTDFFDSSSAGNATFIVKGGQVANGGSMNFNDSSTAASGTFTIEGVTAAGAGGGNVYFFGNSSAGSANFTVDGNQFTNSDPLRGFVAFFQNSTASDAAITANGSTVSGALGGLIEFAGSSTAANATLTATGGSNGGLGGAIEFFEDASGGTSRIQLLGNGSLDVSVHNPPVITVGSIEGSGHVFLGGNELILGGNGLSTEFSGVIHDGGIGGGSGGSLAVLGTLALSGANTYTGNTFVNGGTLFVNNTTGSGTGTGTVHVNDGGTLGGIGKIAGPVDVGAPISPKAFLSPGATLNSIGTLTTDSLLTFINGTLQIDLNSNNGTADQVVANGVTINTSLFGDGLFSLTDLGNSALSNGLQFTIIDNTASSSIAGTFTNLADGSILIAGLNSFRANYEGGDGNNLTLEVVNRANVPDNGMTFSLLTLAFAGLVLLRRNIAGFA